MKTKINTAHPGDKKSNQDAQRKNQELHTDFPLSEKDEVKRAEKRSKSIRQHL